MNIREFNKRMVIEFVGTENVIGFEVELKEDSFVFSMNVKENREKAVEINFYKINNELDIKNSSKYLNLIMNNLISSRQITDEFPILKQIEKELEKLERS